MKKSKVFIYLILFFVAGCSTEIGDYEYVGIYDTKKTNEIEIKFDNVDVYKKTIYEVNAYYDRYHSFQKKHFSTEYYERERNNFYEKIVLNNILEIILPNNIDGSYEKDFMKKKKLEKYTIDYNENFYVFLAYKKIIDNDFRNNLEIFLKINDIIYKPIIDDKECKYIFPIKIKNIKEGILIIKYDEFVKEIPFKYELVISHRN